MRHNRMWMGLVALAAGIAAWPAIGTAQVCPPAPAVCRTAAKSVFMFKNRSDDTADRLLFRWLKGEATDETEIEDPTSLTGPSTALCIYAGTAAGLFSEQIVPPGPGWTSGFDDGDDRYLYKNTVAPYSEGLRWMLLREGGAGRARVMVKGRGVDTPDFALPFTDFPLVVQVHQSDGPPCWGTTFPTAATNHSLKLKARNP